ncbi:MAG: carbon monoxide dehydrogenase subunit G, partial [Thioclava sp.]
MQFEGDHLIPADPETVWRGLNDPEVLRRAIPGCEAMEQTGEAEYTATVVARVGPVAASFRGKVELSDLVPPVSYRITGRGQGGTRSD